MKKLKKEYWMCIIGSTTRDKLPSGADTPMRITVRETFEALTGDEDEHCWSGWGLTEKRMNLILALWSMPEENLPEKIQCE